MIMPLRVICAIALAVAASLAACGGPGTSIKNMPPAPLTSPGNTTIPPSPVRLAYQKEHAPCMARGMFFVCKGLLTEFRGSTSSP